LRYFRRRLHLNRPGRTVARQSGCDPDDGEVSECSHGYRELHPSLMSFEPSARITAVPLASIVSRSRSLLRS
jgi:hypothetical protein